MKALIVNCTLKPSPKRGRRVGEDGAHRVVSEVSDALGEPIPAPPSECTAL